jgi:tetratricopeptide (TPR) repeat protein
MRSKAAAQPVRSESDQLYTIVVCVLLAVIVFVVFGRTLGYDFVNYDDTEYVYENPRISSGLSGDGIAWAFTHVHADNWHPLTTISHMLDCQIFGLQPGGHHFSNVLLHALAAITLFLALRQLTQTLWPSAFVAALFAIHPLRVGSVAWVSERKDVLSGVFFMLTLWAYARYVRSNRPASSQYVFVVLFFALGLLCKPTLVTLPFVLLLLDYWPLRRFPGKSFGALILEKIPLFALSIASCFATLVAQDQAMIAVHQLTFPERIGNAMISYVAYIGQMFWPVGLSVVYPYPDGVNMALAFLAFAVLLVVSVLFFIWREKYPFLLVGWLWFLGVLVPMIGIVQVGAQARADRYTYLSQIGLYILVTWGAVELIRRWPRGRTGFIAVAVVVVVALTAASWVQAGYWRNSETLWNQALANTVNNHIAENNFGDVLNKKGQWDQAELHLRKAVQIYPDYPEANNNLGYALASKGNWKDAMASYRAAMKVRPNYVKAHNNLGIALSEQGKTEEALAEFREALRLDPNFPDAHYNMAAALFRVGRRDEAIVQLRETLRLKPDDKEVREQLGKLGVTN